MPSAACWWPRPSVIGWTFHTKHMGRSSSIAGLMYLFTSPGNSLYCYRKSDGLRFEVLSVLLGGNG